MLPSSPDLIRTFSILAILPFGSQNRLCQGLPDNEGPEDEEDRAIGVQHDGEVFLRLQKQEGEEAMGQEDQVVDLSAKVGGPLSGHATSQQRLEPGAGIEHGEKLFFEVDDDELEEECDVVSAVISVPDGQEDENT